MLARLRLRRPSHATVVAYLALFVALGGTSAVALSGSNTVFSDDIANDNFNSPTEGQGGLVASDLRAGSVGSSEVANGTLKAEDYGIGSVSGARIQDNNVTTLDLADGAIFGNDIRDFSLNDEDVGEIALVNVEETFGTVGTGACRSTPVNALEGRNVSGDHLLLTPDGDTVSDIDFLTYSITEISGTAYITACNHNPTSVDDGTTRFSVLVIDAQ
jgi:hypothetical protein